MRVTCWIVLHAANTVNVFILWITVLAIAFAQLHYEVDEESRSSYIAVQQALTSAVSASVYALFRISHGYANLRALMHQIKNPLLMRSGVSQFVCLVYSITSTINFFFVLLGAETNDSSTEAQFALQWLVLVISVCNLLFVVEQFSHPQLIYCCDNDESRAKLRLRSADIGKAQRKLSGTSMEQTSSMDTVLVEEVEDCSEEELPVTER